MVSDERALTLIGQDTMDLAPRMVMSTEQAIVRLQEFQQFVSRVMVEGTDYGKLPGISKPTLLKPGAEKLCEIYALTPEIEVTNRIEDWQAGFFHYECKCRLINRRTGHTQAEGVGSCNSREDKYRWRNQQAKCPACGAETIAKSKFKPEYYCNKKAGGCGANFGLDDDRISDQKVGKVENTEPFTLVNTILKMAKKRALIDATLSATRSSGLFTQDVEDWIEGEIVPPHEAEPSKPTTAQRPSTPKTPTPPPTRDVIDNGPEPSPPSSAILCANSDCGNIIEGPCRTKDGVVSPEEYVKRSGGLCPACVRASMAPKANGN